MLDDYPGGVAVEAGVVDQHGDEVLGLVAQIFLAPGAGWAGDDDHGADVAELGGDSFVERCALSEDDGFVGAVGAGDVDFVYPRMPAEVGSFFGSAVDYFQEAAGDQRFHPFFEERSEVDVDRMGFIEDDLVFHE